MILCGLPPSERSRAATRSGTVHKILLNTSKDDEAQAYILCIIKFQLTIGPIQGHSAHRGLTILVSYPLEHILIEHTNYFHNYNHFSSHQDKHAESGKSDLLQHENLLRTAQEGLFRYICMEQ